MAFILLSGLNELLKTSENVLLLDGSIKYYDFRKTFVSTLTLLVMKATKHNVE